MSNISHDYYPTRDRAIARAKRTGEIVSLVESTPGSYLAVNHELAMAMHKSGEAKMVATFARMVSEAANVVEISAR